MSKQATLFDHLMKKYLEDGGVISRGPTRKAKGIRHFSLLSKGTKHLGKATYGRGKRRIA